MPDPSVDRPKNREVENEEQRPDGRPATEPEGSEASTRSDKTATDPGTGAAKDQ